MLWELQRNLKTAGGSSPRRIRSTLLILAAFRIMGLAQTAEHQGSRSQPLALVKTRYRLRAGESVALAAPHETINFVKRAKQRTVTVAGRAKPGFVVGPSAGDKEVRIAASLTTEPGEYQVSVLATDNSGEGRPLAVTVTVDPIKSVPSTATVPPVILLNGWQFGPNPTSGQVGTCPISSGSSDTFGSLATLLVKHNQVPVAYFFDNCVEDPNDLIENIGGVLGQVLNLIRYDTGGLVPQVDLVTHSMGGLIARSYLAGLHSNVSLSPPSNPRIRKLVEIATPNFGSFLASNSLGAQTAEMIPGSREDVRKIVEL
jgi:hypothetical protein